MARQVAETAEKVSSKSGTKGATHIAAQQDAATKHRLTQTERLQRKASKIQVETPPDVEDTVFSVTLLGRTPVELFGRLLSVNEKFVVFQYKKERSSKILVSRFQTSDVIRILGNVGEAASILLLRNAPFQTFTGKVANTKSGFMMITAEDGSVIMVNPNLRLDNYALHVTSEASSENTEAEAAAPVKKADKKAGSVTPIGRTKKKAAVVDSDDSAFQDDEPDFT